LDKIKEFGKEMDKFMEGEPNANPTKITLVPDDSRSFQDRLDLTLSNMSEESKNVQWPVTKDDLIKVNNNLRKELVILLNEAVKDESPQNLGIFINKIGDLLVKERTLMGPLETQLTEATEKISGFLKAIKFSAITEFFELQSKAKDSLIQNFLGGNTTTIQNLEKKLEKMNK
jgi:hypothetical protein